MKINKLKDKKNKIVSYKVTNYWHGEIEKNLFLNDPSISIKWPKSKTKPTYLNLLLNDNKGLELNYLLKKGKLF